MRNRLRLAAFAVMFAAALAGADKKKRVEPSPLEAYIAEAEASTTAAAAGSTSGSTWSPGGPLTDLGRDLKASQVNDLVTIVVAERATAVSKGTTKTARDSSARYSVGSIFGKKPPALGSLAEASGSQSLSGEGTTSRENTLTTTLTARVTHVLPNGYLVLEGNKNILVNSETQIVSVRGIARPFDVTPGNQVRSDRLAQIEVRINGKGVVGDAIRRPFFLYRLLMGLLPF